jgi:hypothetical protein
MPYTTINKPSQYFNTVTYSGNGINPTSITSVGFKPDWLWIKCRSNAVSNLLFDAVRGPSKRLISNSTAAESTETQIASFDTNGWTMDADTANNGSGRTYVAWNWLANNTSGSTNTAGSITSTVAANTTAGFSIVSWTGTTGVATVGHGLGTAPAMIILKNRSVVSSWVVYNKTLGATKYLFLDLTLAQQTDSLAWNNTEPDSTKFTINSYTNGSGNSLIAYCFAEVKGYSKAFSYTGNGSTDGTFVYTGFKPAFILIKRTNTTSTWHLSDNKRIGYNPLNYRLEPNNSNTEYTGVEIYQDILSNGFKCRATDSDTNASGSTYVGFAFAENPFVSSTYIPTTAR